MVVEIDRPGIISTSSRVSSGSKPSAVTTAAAGRRCRANVVAIVIAKVVIKNRFLTSRPKNEGLILETGPGAGVRGGSKKVATKGDHVAKNHVIFFRRAE
jgi:hypothetical protein